MIAKIPDWKAEGVHVDYRLPAVVGPNFFQCDLTGVAGITPVYVKAVPTGRSDWPTKFIARVGIAIFGGVMCEESIGKNPFDEDFHDNYVEAKAMTKTALWRVLQRKMKSLADSLWS